MRRLEVIQTDHVVTVIGQVLGPAHVDDGQLELQTINNQSTNQ